MGCFHVVTAPYCKGSIDLRPIMLKQYGQIHWGSNFCGSEVIGEVDFLVMAAWPSGKAGDCKSLIRGSNPRAASSRGGGIGRRSGLKIR